MPKAIIMVPAEGDHFGHFQIVAKTLRTKVYGGDATIVTVRLAKTKSGLPLAFAVLDGPKIAWEQARYVASFITISHGGRDDGPIIKPHAYGSENQPWGCDPDGVNLRDEGKAFWKKVGATLSKKYGKIILFGCNMGEGKYASLVAKAAGATTYAANGKIAAADNDTALTHVKAIERGKAESPMVNVGP